MITFRSLQSHFKNIGNKHKDVYIFFFKDVYIPQRLHYKNNLIHAHLLYSTLTQVKWPACFVMTPDHKAEMKIHYLSEFKPIV